jgi:hypothetical protein
MQLFMGGVNSEVYQPIVTQPAPIPFVMNPAPSAELNVLPLDPAPIQFTNNPAPVDTVYVQRPEVLAKDANWGVHSSFPFSGEKMFWSSYTVGALQSDTGSLDYGYFLRGTASTLWILMGGGGLTNGELKRVEVRKESDNTIVLISNLAVLIGADIPYAQHWVGLPLVLLGADELFYLRFIDNDGGNSYSWMAVDFDSIIFED